MNFEWQAVVQIGKCNTILRPDWLTYNDFIDVIKLVPVLIILAHIAYQWFELRTPRDRNVQSFGGKERFHVEEIEKVSVGKIREELVAKAIQGGLHGQ